MFNKKCRFNISVYLPIIFFIAIIPLIVKGKIGNYPNLDNVWFNQNNYADFFYYYKSLFIQIAAGISLFMYFFLLFKGVVRFKWNLINKLLVAMLSFVILSYLFSDYKEVVSIGFRTRFEGFYVSLSYIWITFYTASIVKTRDEIKLIIYSLFASGFVLGFIGLLQYFGTDPFRMNSVLKLIVPKSVLESGSMDSVQFRMAENRVYMTLYNPNYVGVYTSMIISFCLGVLVRKREIIIKIVSLLLIILLAIGLIGSLSRGGFIGILIAFIVGVIVSYKKIIENYKVTLLILLLSGIFIFINFDFIENNYFSRLESGFDIEKNIKDGLQGFESNGKELEMFIDDTKYTFLYSDDLAKVKLIDENNQPIAIEYNSEDMTFKFDHPQLEHIVMRHGNINLGNELRPYIQLNLEERRWNFALLEEAFAFVHQNSLSPITYAEFYSPLKGYEKVGNSRGYIWSRSIPIAKDYFLFGTGSDSFPYVFPQNDYVYKYHALGNQLVDKPHNLYLLLAINHGIIFLSIFMFLVLYVAIKLVTIYHKDASEYALPLVLAIVAYLGSGIFNDSTVATAPVFWVILGLSISVINNTQLQINKSK